MRWPTVTSLQTRLKTETCRRAPQRSRAANSSLTLNSHVDCWQLQQLLEMMMSRQPASALLSATAWCNGLSLVWGSIVSIVLSAPQVWKVLCRKLVKRLPELMAGGPIHVPARAVQFEHLNVPLRNVGVEGVVGVHKVEGFACMHRRGSRE